MYASSSQPITNLEDEGSRTHAEEDDVRLNKGATGILAARLLAARDCALKDLSLDPVLVGNMAAPL